MKKIGAVICIWIMLTGCAFTPLSVAVDAFWVAEVVSGFFPYTGDAPTETEDNEESEEIQRE